MHPVIRFFQVFAFIFLIMLLHALVAYFFPYPFNKINMLFLCLFIFLLLTHSGMVVWVSFFAHWLIELYPSGPFGVVFISATLSFLAVYWISESIISRQTWIGSVALLAMSLILFRILYTVLFMLFQQSTDMAWFSLLTLYMWEFLLTTFCLFIVYPILLMVFPQLQGRRLRS